MFSAAQPVSDDFVIAVSDAITGFLAGQRKVLDGIGADAAPLRAGEALPWRLVA